jgi:hypothetical protein
LSVIGSQLAGIGKSPNLAVLTTTKLSVFERTREPQRLLHGVTSLVPSFEMSSPWPQRVREISSFCALSALCDRRLVA